MTDTLATSDGEELVLYSDEDEAEYQRLLVTLNQEHPIAGSKGFDFSRLKGIFPDRCTKAIILQLALTGHRKQDIAEWLGYSLPAFMRWFDEAVAEAIPIEDVEALRKVELEGLELQKRESWDQFHGLAPPLVITTERETKDGTFTTIVTKGYAGSPAYQKILLDISKQRSDLLGLNKPTKTEVSKTERKVVVHVMEVKNREEAIAAAAAGLLK